MTGFHSSRPREPLGGAHQERTPGNAARFAAAAMPPYFGQSASEGQAYEPGGAQRREPQLGETSVPPGAAEDYVRNYAAIHDATLPGRRVPGLLAMIAVFVVGAAVGLGAAWWMTSQGSSAHTPTLDVMVNARGGTGESGSARGISADELPYDGATSRPAHGAVYAASEDKQRVADRADARMVDDVPDVSQVTASKPDTPSPASSTVTTASANAIENLSASVRPRTARSDSTQQSRAQLADRTRNHEIDRIRQQADSELKKKTEPRVVRESRPRSGRQEIARQEPSALSARVQTAAVRVRLAQCEGRPNILSREVCKWRLCNGRWGRNGCPSYAPQQPSY